ncbi:MAG: response regulator [Pyrinomonadaceae bacterium]
MISIVIVEDDPILAAIYEHKLKDVDCSIQTATDGQFGYELILKTKPDLVLLDLTLPGLSGADILERLRAQEEFKEPSGDCFFGFYHECAGGRRAQS